MYIRKTNKKKSNKNIYEEFFRKAQLEVLESLMENDR